MRLHVQLSELQSLDSDALAYVAQSKSIHKEALQYFQACQVAQRTLDPIVVHSFTLRREAAARTAFADIQSQIAPGSFTALQQYVNSEFPKSIHILR